MVSKKLFFISFLLLFIFFLFPLKVFGGEIGVLHQPLFEVKGSTSTPTTLTLFLRAGAEEIQNAPVGEYASSSDYLIVKAYYKNPGDSGFSFSFCKHLGVGYHSCEVLVASGEDGRSFQYYLELSDGTSTIYLPENNWENTPFEVSVKNNNPGSSSLAGEILSDWFYQTTNFESATTSQVTIELQGLDQMKFNVGDYALIEDPQTLTNETVQVMATSSNSITVNSLSNSYPTSSLVYKKIAGAWVYLQGTDRFSTSSVNGTFQFDNLDNHPYDIEVFKENYLVAGLGGIPSGKTDLRIFMTEGQWQGGLLTVPPFVIWSAPMDGMMSAPRDISLDAFPILISFSREMATSTFTTSSVLLKKFNPNDGSTEDVTTSSGMQFAYQPGNSSFVVNGKNYNFGPEPKLVVYSETPLDGDSVYLLELTQAVTDSSGNPLEGNRPGGGYVLMFTTAADLSSMTPDQYGEGGNFMPPFVKGMVPPAGSFSVGTNYKFLMIFSEPMDTNSLSENIKLFKVDNPFSSTETETEVSISVSLDSTTKENAIITPQSLSSNAHYRFKVFGGARSVSGITIGPPENSSMVVFSADFDTGSEADSMPPRIVGTNLDNYATTSGALVNVPVAPIIEIGFDKTLDLTTVNANTVVLKSGSTQINGTVEFDPTINNLRFIPSSALSPNLDYTLTLLSGENGIKDLAGNQLDGDGDGTGGDNYTLVFTTGDADTQSPTPIFANADNFSVAIAFSEPMNAAKSTDATKWSSSVLNPNNYQITFSSNTEEENTANLTNAIFEYEPGVMTVKIKGIQTSQGDMLPVGNLLKVQVSQVSDLSGNSLATTTLTATIQDSKETFGILGPVMGGMMGPPPEAGGSMGPMIGMHDPSLMGMEPVGVFPMNAMAGKETVYFVDLPIKVLMKDGYQIVLTFPSGFDVSNVIPDPYSPANSDFNHEGPGTITFDTTFDSDGIAVDPVARSVTIKLDVSDTPPSSDFYHFDLKGVKNSTIPKDFGTSGYTVDIKIKDNQDTILDSMVSMPFFITESGDYTISGTISATSTDSNFNGIQNNQTIKVFLGSPMTGPIETTATFNNGTASYSFSGLNEGEYFLFTKPLLSLTTLVSGGSTTTKDFSGAMIPEPIRIPDPNNSSYNASSKTLTKNLTLSDASSGAKLEVYLKGNFANSKVDIFAGSNSGFVVKTVGPLDNLTNWKEFDLYLPYNDIWHIGIGPALPEGPMFQGPPPTVDWMPPSDIEVEVSGLPDSASIKESSQDANDGKVYFEVVSASHQIIGYVKDTSGNPIPDAGVDAFRVEGFGAPAHTQTDSQGRFVLKVGIPSGASEASYGLSVFKPGLPPIPPKTVLVKENSDNSDGNLTADVYLEGGVLVTDDNPLIIRVAKSSLTISGKVLDDADLNVAQPAAFVPVWAYNEETGDFIPSGTDSAGTYILYVKNGTWKVQAHLPDLGDLPPVTVVITDSSVGDINLKPAQKGSQMGTVSGEVLASSQPVTDAHIWVEGQTSSGLHYENGTKVDDQGKYQLKVPAGSYNVHCWTPTYGEVGKQSISSINAGGTKTINFSIDTSQLSILTFQFQNATSSMQGFVDVFNPSTEKGNGIEVSDLSSSDATLKVPAGDYQIMAHISGFGDFSPTSPQPNSQGLINLSPGTTTIIFTLPSSSEQVLLSGQVTSSGNPVADAFVWVENFDLGYHFGAMTNASGTYSLRIAKGTYRVGVDKPGYSSVPQNLTISQDTTYNITLERNQNYIRGTIYDDSGSPVSHAWVWAEKVVSQTDLTPTGGWAGAETDGSGNYELSVGEGWWWVHSKGEGFKETWRTSAVYAGGSTNPTGINLNLVPLTNFSLKKPKSKSIIPAQGGTIDDRNDTGVKLVVPAGALGSDANNGKIILKETTAVPETDAKTPLGGKGKTIEAYDSTDSAIKNLSGRADVEIVYDEDDLPEGFSESQLSLGYFDDSTKEWIEIPAIIDTDNNTIKAKISHFSIFAPLLPSDSSVPTVPGTPSATINDNSITVSWTASTDDVAVAGYEVYRSTSPNGTFSNISGDSTSQGYFDATKLVARNCSGTCTWTDNSGFSNNTTYYYKVAAFDTSGNHSTSSAASEGVLYHQGGGISIITTGGGGATGYASKEEEKEEKEETEEEEVEEKVEEEEIDEGVEDEEVEDEEIEKGDEEVGEGTEEADKEISEIKTLEVSPIFERDLEYGESSEEVRQLQQLLTSDKEIYPEGRITGYFGSLTLKAVQRFQCKYGIVCEGSPQTTGFGRVGPKTRAKLQEVFGSIKTKKIQIQKLKTKIVQLQRKVLELLKRLYELLLKQAQE